MLRTNLSTRPFYNERAVHVCLALSAILVVALTVFNLWEIYSLSGRDARVRTSIEQADAPGAGPSSRGGAHPERDQSRASSRRSPPPRVRPTP